MVLTKDFYKFSLYTLLWFIPLTLVVNGTAQEMIHFADPLNEMGTAFMLLMGFVINAGIAISELIKSFKTIK